MVIAPGYSGTSGSDAGAATVYARSCEGSNGRDRAIHETVAKASAATATRPVRIRTSRAGRPPGLRMDHHRRVAGARLRRRRLLTGAPCAVPDPGDRPEQLW